MQEQEEEDILPDAKVNSFLITKCSVTTIIFECVHIKYQKQTIPQNVYGLML